MQQLCRDGPTTPVSCPGRARQVTPDHIAFMTGTIESATAFSIQPQVSKAVSRSHVVTFRG